jgi:hypothetical protein
MSTFTIAAKFYQIKAPNIDYASHTSVEAIFEGAILKGFISIDIRLCSAYPRD